MGGVSSTTYAEDMEGLPYTSQPIFTRGKMLSTVARKRSSASEHQRRRWPRGQRRSEASMPQPSSRAHNADVSSSYGNTSEPRDDESSETSEVPLGVFSRQAAHPIAQSFGDTEPVSRLGASRSLWPAEGGGSGRPAHQPDERGIDDLGQERGRAVAYRATDSKRVSRPSSDIIVQVPESQRPFARASDETASDRAALVRRGAELYGYDDDNTAETPDASSSSGEPNDDQQHPADRNALTTTAGEPAAAPETKNGSAFLRHGCASLAAHTFVHTCSITPLSVSQRLL